MFKNKNKITIPVEPDEYAIIFKKNGHYFYQDSVKGAKAFHEFWEGFLDNDNDSTFSIIPIVLEFAKKRREQFLKEMELENGKP